MSQRDMVGVIIKSRRLFVDNPRSRRDKAEWCLLYIGSMSWWDEILNAKGPFDRLGQEDDLTHHSLSSCQLLLAALCRLTI